MNYLKNSNSNFVLGNSFLYSLYFIPPVCKAIFDLSSYSSTIVTINLLLFSLCRLRAIPLNLNHVFFSITIFIALFISSLGTQYFSSYHIFSAFGMALFMLNASDFSKILKSTSEHVLKKNLRLFFIVATSTAIFGILFRDNIPIYSDFPVSVFPFTEPSHFAISICSLFLYFVYTSKSGISISTIFVLLLFFVISIFTPSLILLIITLIAALLGMNKLRWYFVMPALFVSSLGFLYIFGTFADAEYFSNRLDFISSSNLSLLIFQLGWIDMLNILENTYFGLGFQNYSTRPLDPFSIYIYDIAGMEMNRSDGSFLMSKAGGEFGLLGILFYLYLVGSVIKRFFVEKKFNQYAYFIGCVGIGFLIEFFIRGVGYFSFTQFLFFTVALYSISSRLRA